jgi:beta-phosphoglucomutase-like phosphatase (HAD superfamily)
LSLPARPVPIDYRPTGLIVLHPNQHIEIEAQGVIFDVDETILEGTGEHVHDGPEARFAKAIAELLKQEGKDFDLGLWDKNYRPLTGLAESAVCNRLALQVMKDYGVVISPRDLQDLSNRLVDERFLEFMERVTLVENVHGLIDRISGRQLRLAVCTASSQRFIERALHHFGLFSKFTAHVFEATKKIGEHLFSGDPVQDACMRLHLAPQTCVMIGDSISDFGAAASGEVPLDIIVLRLPAAGRDQALRKFQEQRANALAKNGDALSRTVVVVVDNYDQVRVSYSPQARVSYRVPPIEHEIDA